MHLSAPPPPVDISPGPPRVALFFPGQSSACTGDTYQDLWNHSPVFRAEIASYQSIADAQGLPNFAQAISEGTRPERPEDFTQVQLAAVAGQVALAHLWESWGVTPSVVTGCGFGEYAALCFAGVLSVSDTLLLVASCADLLGRNLAPAELGTLSVPEGALPALASRPGKGVDSCGAGNITSPVCVTLTERTDPVEGPQSSQVEPVLDEVERLAQTAVFHDPNLPVASTLLGKVVTGPGAFGPSYLRDQLRCPAQLASAFGACRASGLVEDDSVILTVGSNVGCAAEDGSVASAGHGLRIVPHEPTASALTAVTSSMALLYERGIDLKWSEYYPHSKCGVHGEAPLNLIC